MKFKDAPKVLEILGSPCEYMGNLGSGGNSIVCKYRNDKLENFAVKFLRNTAPEPLARFEQEIDFHLRFDAISKGILPMITSGTITIRGKQVPFMVMPVAECMINKISRPMEVLEALQIIGNCAKTLKTLSDHNILHRDIKPDNLFLHAGEWKIGDFGLVSLPEKKSLYSGKKVGPIYYIAPEMMIGANVSYTEKADVFSLSKVLWYLLTPKEYEHPMPGNQPRDSVYSSLVKVLNTDDKNLSYIDTIIDYSTKTDPSVRWGWQEFSSNIETLININRNQTKKNMEQENELENLLNQLDMEDSGTRELREARKTAFNVVHSEIHEIYKKWTNLLNTDPKKYDRFKLKDFTTTRQIRQRSRIKGAMAAYDSQFEVIKGEGKTRKTLGGGFSVTADGDGNYWLFCGLFIENGLMLRHFFRHGSKNSYFLMELFTTKKTVFEPFNWVIFSSLIRNS